MSDAADRLAQALRDLLKEAVEEAVTRQPVPHGTQPAGAKGRGDPVDEDTRREYEKRFGEPVPRYRGERRLISVAEARHQLGGISPTTFYGLVNEGELSLVKIGSRSFVQPEELDDFVRRKRNGSPGRPEN
jgi:hypothetical protein